jgi:hypothetical protein
MMLYHGYTLHLCRTTLIMTFCYDPRCCFCPVHIRMPQGALLGEMRARARACVCVCVCVCVSMHVCARVNFHVRMHDFAAEFDSASWSVYTRLQRRRAQHPLAVRC